MAHELFMFPDAHACRWQRRWREPWRMAAAISANLGTWRETLTTLIWYIYGPASSPNHERKLFAPGHRIISQCIDNILAQYLIGSDFETSVAISVDGIRYQQPTASR